MTDFQGRPARSAPWTQNSPRWSTSRTGAEPAAASGASTADTGARKQRLIGIDAARGLALIGMISIHIMPSWDPVSFEPTAQWTVFAGRSAALFALLAGVGLAFSTGGQSPHTGRAMTADRVGVVVRALLIAGLGLVINEVIPGDSLAEVPAVNILVYYGVIFLLAVPFLSLSARALFTWAGFFALAGPVLMYLLRDVLPAVERYNPALTDLVGNPGATTAQLVLTGTFPALPYLAYLLAGVAIGRLDLADVGIQTTLLSLGVILAVTAWFAYWVLILQAGGYDQLLAHTPALDEELIDDIINFGPDPALPTTTWWWLAIAGPYTNTPLALLLGLGSAIAVLGLFLLLARGAGNWLLPLSAMGSMTLTVYSAHLLGLSAQLHYDQPMWFLIHMGVALVFALIWHKVFGQGPLERVVAGIVRIVRRLVLGRHRQA